MKACLGNGWAGATGLGVERESQGKKDAGWWVQAGSRRALPASPRNLDFAGQKEPMKFLVRGVNVLIAVCYRDCSGSGMHQSRCMKMAVGEQLGGNGKIPSYVH